MVEWIMIGAAAGGLAVKAWDFFMESVQDPMDKLPFAEREAYKKKLKEDKEVREWANRAVLSDDAFKALKAKIESYSKIEHANFSYPQSLVKSVMDHGMRFSINQIQELKPSIIHWCVYEGKTDKKRAEINYIELVNEILTAKVEAREAILNLLIEESP